jgi:hypothetical protein
LSIPARPVPFAIDHPRGLPPATAMGSSRACRYSSSPIASTARSFASSSSISERSPGPGVPCANELWYLIGPGMIATRARQSGGANCDSQAAGPRGRDHVGMYAQSSLRSRSNPSSRINGQTPMCTSPIRATAPWRRAAESIRARTVLERGSQQQRGHTGDQRSGDRSKPPA